ncbi:hypothetical protein C8R44DRAFT_738733 [Mycena epipterygia]|nr:hypothetical protein C8R44DRAFT_738733 [Mycena epipterygia]
MSACESIGASPPPTGSIPRFENQCGHRGCPHIFRYEGTNPFEALAVMVRVHRPHCVGRNSDTTHPCRIAWQPSEEMVKHFLQADADTLIHGEDYNYPITDVHDTGCERPHVDQPYHQVNDEQNCATDIYMDEVACASQPAEQQVQLDQDDVMHDLAEDISIDSRSDSAGSRATSSYTAGDETDTTSHKAAPRKPKKTARKEDERRALLVNDPWTLAVELNHVVCRGCERSIKLDGRSRYYPGLWQKHRGRCPGIQEGREMGKAKVKSVWLLGVRVLTGLQTQRMKRSSTAAVVCKMTNGLRRDYCCRQHPLPSCNLNRIHLFLMPISPWSLVSAPHIDRQIAGRKMQRVVARRT